MKCTAQWKVTCPVDRPTFSAEPAVSCRRRRDQTWQADWEFACWMESLNTGEDAATGKRVEKATQTIYHNARYPSHPARATLRRIVRLTTREVPVASRLQRSASERRSLHSQGSESLESLAFLIGLLRLLICGLKVRCRCGRFGITPAKNGKRFSDSLEHEGKISGQFYSHAAIQQSSSNGGIGPPQPAIQQSSSNGGIGPPQPKNWRRFAELFSLRFALETTPQPTSPAEPAPSPNATDRIERMMVRSAFLERVHEIRIRP